MNQKMLSTLRKFLSQIQTEIKIRDWTHQMNSCLAYARQIMKVKEEQFIHRIATIFIVYLIFGWNGFFLGCLFLVYLLLSFIDFSIAINETHCLFYSIVYVALGLIEYFCFNYQFPFYIIYIGKCFFLIWLVFPDQIHDNIIIVHRSICQFVYNYNKQNQEFYNTKAGQSNVEDANSYDQYHNPIDREYDLGRDGAFTGYRISIGQFYKSGDMKAPIQALEMKGFHVENVKTELEFISKLQSNHYQIVWVISSSSIEQTSFIPILLDFHSKGGAVFLFADNVPYVSHASEFLNKKFGITLLGNYQGNKTLVFNENGYSEAGRFGQHEIFTGIKNLFEGVTICHPVQLKPIRNQSMVTLATATDGQSCITIFDPPHGSSEGRLCLDCGFTKLFINWNSAGTARFIVNASCWLTKAMK